MAQFPEPLGSINRDVIEDYLSNLPPDDQKILREYYTPVSAVLRELRDTPAASNKDEDVLIGEALDQVEAGIPERRKKKICRILNNTYEYCEPRFMELISIEPSFNQSNILIPGSNCHYTKDFLMLRNRVNARKERESKARAASGEFVSAKWRNTIYDVHSCNKTVIPTTATDLTKYQRIKIIELAPEKTHSNKVIYATVVGEGYTIQAFYTVIEDEFGQCASLAIYSISQRLQQSLRRGAKITLVNPFYKAGKYDGLYFIRVDSPEEVVVIKEQDMDIVKSGEDWKNEGNNLFKSGKFEEAISCYTRAITMDNRKAAYFSNRALTYLELKLYEEALVDAESAVRMEPENKKFHCRLASAWSGLGNHGKSVEILGNINTNRKDSGISSFLNHERYYRNNTKGKFNFAEIKSKLEQGQEVKIGEYIGPVEIGPTPNGHGLFATRDIKKGELIMVCRPVALVPESNPCKTGELSIEFDPDGPMVSNSWEKMTQKVTEKMSESKLTSFRLFHLYNKMRDVPISTELYKSKGYEIIRDKVKPPYQMEQIREIIKKHSLSIEYRDTCDHTCHNPRAYVGIWLLPSFMNNSCVPNTFRCLLNDICIIQSCVFIPKGSELTEAQSVLYREYELGGRRAFLDENENRCDCNLCEFESDPQNADILLRAIDLRKRAQNLSESNQDDSMQDPHFEILNELLLLAEELGLGPKRFNADFWLGFNYCTKNFTTVSPKDHTRFIELFQRAKSRLFDSEVWHRFFYWHKLIIFSAEICETAFSKEYLDEILRNFQEIDSLIITMN